MSRTSFQYSKRKNADPFSLKLEFTASITNVYALSLREDGLGFYYNVVTSPTMYHRAFSAPFSFEVTGVRDQVSVVQNYNAGMRVNPAGTKITYVSDQTKKIRQKTMTAPHDLTTAGNEVVMSIPNFSNPMFVSFNNDGTIIYSGGGPQAVKAFELTTPYDITTYNNTTYDVYTSTRWIDGFCFFGNGEFFAVSSRDDKKVEYYRVSIPYDCSTIIDNITFEEPSWVGDIHIVESGNYALHSRLSALKFYKLNLWK